MSAPKIDIKVGTGGLDTIQKMRQESQKLKKEAQDAAREYKKALGTANEQAAAKKYQLANNRYGNAARQLINAQRESDGRVDNVYDLKEQLEELFEPQKAFKRNARSFFKNTKIGRGLTSVFSNPGVQQGLAGGGMALGIAGAAASAFTFAAEFDRKFNEETANLDEQIKVAKILGKDTDGLMRERERSEVNNRLGYRMADGLAGEVNKLPVVGGFVASIISGGAQTIKNLELNEKQKQQKEFEDLTSGLSSRQQEILRDRAINEVDGGSAWWSAWRRNKQLGKNLISSVFGETAQSAMYDSKEGQEVLRKVSEAIAKANSYRAEAYKQIDMGQLDAGQEFLNLSAQKIGGNPRDAVQEWMTRDSMRKNEIDFARSLAGMPPTRLGG